MKILDQNKFNLFSEKSKQVRLYILDMLTNAKSSHLGSALSIVDILTVLFNDFIDVGLIRKHSPNRDYCILSKGHAASALYATLASVGVFSEEILQTYCKDGSKLAGHPIKDCVPGVEASTGSLGHGLPLAVGLAIALKKDGLKNKVYVLLGDGECQEGSVWEAVQLAVRLKLNNLVVIVDSNKWQGLDRTQEICVCSLEQKFSVFGCNTVQIDGHDFNRIFKTLNDVGSKEFPDVIIANTIKGKGISFVQDKLEWHYKSANEEEYKIAKKEILGI
jgi:transketolase